MGGQVGSCLGIILLSTSQHFSLCPISMAQCSRMSETQKTSRQNHKQKHNQKATKRQLRTKWPISTPNSEHEVWSFHTTIIRLKTVTCFAYVAISEAACASQRLHTISCDHAMCLLGLLFQVISHLRVQSWALATIFTIALSFVLLLLLPVMQVCPFVATCVAKSSCPQPKFCHWICHPCFYPGYVFASVFCLNCCHHRCPCQFFVVHVALQIPIAIATAIVFALENAMVVAIKFRRLIEHCSWILDNIYCNYIASHIYICIYIYIHIHTYVYIYIYLHTHIHTYTHTHIYTYTDTHIYTYTDTHIYTHIHIHTYTHKHIHTYTHTHIHTYIHTHIHTYIHTYIHSIHIYIYICIHMYTYTYYLGAITTHGGSRSQATSADPFFRPGHDGSWGQFSQRLFPLGVVG